MKKNDVAGPISSILDGTNYIIGAYQMRNFLIGGKLWHIVTGDVTKLVKPTFWVKNIKDTTGKDNSDPSDATVQKTTIEDDKYIEKLED